jgi:hypothetical protein
MSGFKPEHLSPLKYGVIHPYYCRNPGHKIEKQPCNFVNIKK